MTYYIVSQPLNLVIKDEHSAGASSQEIAITPEKSVKNRDIAALILALSWVALLLKFNRTHNLPANRDLESMRKGFSNPFFQSAVFLVYNPWFKNQSIWYALWRATVLIYIYTK